MKMLTNFDRKKLPQYKKAVKIANLYENNRFRIERNAFDRSGKLLPDHLSLWVTTDGDSSRFWKVYDEC